MTSIYAFSSSRRQTKQRSEQLYAAVMSIDIMDTLTLWTFILSWQDSSNTAITLLWLFFSREKNYKFNSKRSSYILKNGSENLGSPINSSEIRTFGPLHFNRYWVATCPIWARQHWTTFHLHSNSTGIIVLLTKEVGYLLHPSIVIKTVWWKWCILTLH